MPSAAVAAQRHQVVTLISAAVPLIVPLWEAALLGLAQKAALVQPLQSVARAVRPRVVWDQLHTPVALGVMAVNPQMMAQEVAVAQRDRMAAATMVAILAGAQAVAVAVALMEVRLDQTALFSLQAVQVVIIDSVQAVALVVSAMAPAAQVQMEPEEVVLPAMPRMTQVVRAEQANLYGFRPATAQQQAPVAEAVAEAINLSHSEVVLAV